MLTCLLLIMVHQIQSFLNAGLRLRHVSKIFLCFSSLSHKGLTSKLNVHDTSTVILFIVFKKRWLHKSLITKEAITGPNYLICFVHSLTQH